jgi:pimeloyl-ACP methyl ester carboxylesterase
MRVIVYLFIFFTGYTFSYEHESTFFEHCRGVKKEFSAIGEVFFKAKVKESEHDPKKPAVLLVHGLSASPKHWHRTIPELEKAGFDVYYVYVQYGKPDGFKKSIDKIKNVATSIFKEHKTLHLVGHSLGGVASIEVAYLLQQEGYPIKKVVTINSPLKGTFMMNGLTQLAFPPHLVEILKPSTVFQKELSEKGKKLFESKVDIFHVATETDHLVPGVDTCFLNHCKDKMILKGTGHLSAINESILHKKLIDWLKENYE